MREIKFRAKDILHKEWYFGSLARDIPQNSYYIIDENYGSGVDVDENTVGQYTGLKDKNRKEIYEGDIVKSYYYIDTENGEAERYNKKQVKFNDINCEYNVNKFENLEVIGNIYENSDLLEGADNIE